MLRQRTLASVVALLSLVAGLVVATPPAPAVAASASNFTPGNLISDANFFDGNAMSAAQVQAFLEQKRPTCTSGYTCLRDYSQSTPAMGATVYCDALEGRSSERASSIIARVGLACDVSPRALLVLLEKEQSLVTSSQPTSRQYDRATGFACPDTAPCDPAFGNFFYQVYNAARQFQRYALYPANYNHRVGTMDVLYHPNAACGAAPVRIENQATAGLYNYTPYQPNAAALANLYGTGDACSSYGNRNFWRIYTDWFGDPRGGLAGPSVGALDARATSGGLQVSVTGWALDPDVATPIAVHIYANAPFPNGWNAGTLIANQASGDRGSAIPDGRTDVGFSGSLTMPSGTTRVCAHAIDATGDGNTMIGCADVSPVNGSPYGNFERTSSAAASGTLSGWALDPDSTGPISLHVYRGGPYGVGSWVGSFAADEPRSDVERAISTAGAAHGFEIPVSLPSGGDSYCIHAINTRGGENRLLGCRTAEPQTGSPKGNFEAATGVPGGIAINGWALDPDTLDSARVQVTVDGRAWSTLTADGSRQDVARYFPGYGDARGFTATLQTGAGAHTVCVRAIDVGVGSDVTIGCRVAEALGGPARGNFERLEQGAEIGQLSVTGWALDPDTASASRVRVTVDGSDAGPFTADGDRPDVARYFPQYGPQHGFRVPLDLAAGDHRVCVTAVDSVGGQSSTSLGCRSVTVAGGPPRGNFESASVSADRTSAMLRGWALDPDTVASIQVRVSVDGRDVGAFTASSPRTDVQRSFPAYGSAHGFDIRVPIAQGTHRVCVTAVDAAGGQPSTLLACRTVENVTASPMGVFDGATIEGTAAVVHGWAFDPDATTDVRVRVTVNGAVAAEMVANQSRPDVERAIAAADATTGFRGSVPVPTGTSTMCVVALDAVGGDPDRSLGCRSVTR